MLPIRFSVSTTFFSYPSSSSALLTGVPVTSPRRRSMALEPGDRAMAAPATRSDANTNARSGSIKVTLHLDLDDVADPDIANHLHHDRRHQQLLAEPLMEQEIHVRRIDHRQRRTERRRERHQDPAGEPAVRRMDADLAEDLEPLAHDVRQVVENLREVAAGVALNQDGGHEEPDVEERHAVRQLVERVSKRQTEVLLIETLLELGTDRIEELVGHHPPRGLEAMSGAYRARQQIERFGELLLASLAAAASLMPQQHHRHDQS